MAQRENARMAGRLVIKSIIRHHRRRRRRIGMAASKQHGIEAKASTQRHRNQSV